MDAARHRPAFPCSGHACSRIRSSGRAPAVPALPSSGAGRATYFQSCRLYGTLHTARLSASHPTLPPCCQMTALTGPIISATAPYLQPAARLHRHPRSGSRPGSCSSIVASTSALPGIGPPARQSATLSSAGLHPGISAPPLRPCQRKSNHTARNVQDCILARQRRGPADRPEQKFFQGWMGVRGKEGTGFTKNVPSFPRQTKCAPPQTYRGFSRLTCPTAAREDIKKGRDVPPLSSFRSVPLPSGDRRDIMANDLLRRHRAQAQLGRCADVHAMADAAALARRHLHLPVQAVILALLRPGAIQ